MIPDELTERHLELAAMLLSKDNNARYTQRWLWNNADSQYVQMMYFQRMIAHCHEALKLATAIKEEDVRFGQPHYGHEEGKL